MRWIFILFLTVWAGSAAAQTSDDDRDWITGLIEDSISNDAMTVRLSNFQGALSSKATADSITIADPDGVWLRLDGLTFGWNRSALLSGRVEVDELSAQRIELIRLPAAQDAETDLPDAQATPFTLPELPVSIEITNVSAAEIVLTEDLLGEPIVARFQGALSLIGGAATAQILLERSDEKQGRFDIDASYTQDTQQLALFLLAEEGENGIAARLLDLPDTPSVRLEVSGDAPLDDFVANIALATDTVDRVTGTAQISRPTGTTDQAFAFDLQGDLRPFLDPEYETFFGKNTILQVEGTSFGEGGLSLSNLLIGSDQLVLRGSAALDAEGWPEAIDLRGRLGSGGANRVLLPISGTPIEVSGVSLNVQYDVADGDAWTGAFDVTSFVRDGVTVDALTLAGGGIIVPGAGGSAGEFTAELAYAARGLGLDDPALIEAVGEDIEGTITIGRAEDGPLDISELTLTGAGLTAQGRALVQGPDGRFQTEANLTINADDFTRFAAVTGLDLSGNGEVTLRGDIQPFDGIFNVFLAARTTNLSLGIDQLDPILEGDAIFSLRIDRDTTGTRLQRIRLASGALIAQGEGEINGQTARATFNADLNNLAILEPSLSGPASLQADLSTDAQGRVTLDTNLTAPHVNVGVQGIATPAETGYVLRGDGTISIDELRAYGDLIGQDLSGGVSLDLDGSFTTATGALDAGVIAQTRDLQSPSAELNKLIAGLGRVTVNVDRSDTGRLRLEELDVAFTNLTAQGRAEIDGRTASATFNAGLTDLGIFTPSLSGPATLQADISTDAQGLITLDTNLSAPRANATVQGTATPADTGYVLRGDGVITIDELRAYGDLIGQELGGGLTLDLDGSFTTATGAMNAGVVAQTRDLQAGSTEINQILAGLGRVSANVSLSEAGRLRLDALDVAFPNLTASGAVASSGSDTTANLSVRLRDVGLFVSDFSGPLTADISASQDTTGWQVTGDANGPVQTAARVSGRVSNAGQLNLAITGSAPLAPANLYIAPQQVSGLATFDLTVDGPPALDSVRGRITISDTRLAAPTLQQAIEDVSGTILLTGGTTRLDLRGTNVNGGTLTLSGPITLSPPFRGELVVGIDEFIVTDPALYRTAADGQITVTGPLTGGALIAGTINLGSVEVQVPSTGVSALGSLPEVTHLGIPTRIRETLTRAGVGVAPPDTTGATSSGPGFGIDLTVRAPSRIFIRGRGLEAELGGQLRLTGNTNNIVPIGRFDLVRGRLSILGQRFELTEGFAQLQGDFTPFLRLVATTQARTGTNVSIVVEGSADDIEVRFESTPELPQDEVLAQILFGRDLSSISPLQAVQLASAVATLAGGDEGVVGRLRSGLDLDDLDLVTDADGNVGVRAGKYISDRVYTDVTVGVQGESEINLNIDIDRNFTARGSVGSDGETSVGIFFERDY